MKKLLALLAVAAAALAFPLTHAEAGDCYRSKVLHRCGTCGHNVLSYYRPIRVVGTRHIFGWVPNLHSNCGVSLHGSVYGNRIVHTVSPYRSNYGARNYHNFGYGKGVVRRPIPSIRTDRTYLSGRVISTQHHLRPRSYGACR